MGEQYFTAKPQSIRIEKRIEVHVGGKKYAFDTDNGVFSKHRMDYGSKVLVESFKEHVEQVGTLLELGSGYGPVAIALGAMYPDAQVTGVEINERALELAHHNATLNRVDNAQWVLSDATTWQSDQGFEYVVTNPPIRAGKAVIQAFVENAHRLLVASGELWVVIQKKQGAPSMETFMETLFGNAEIITRDKGYWILRSVKEN